MKEITEYIAEKGAKARKKKSLRTSIIVHIIILILAMLPFLSMKPDPTWQTIQVVFEEIPDVSSGSSNEGAKKSASSSSSDQASEPVAEETSQEEVTPVEEVAVEEVAMQEVVEVKPLESTPIVTSPSDAPSLPEVKEVKVKVPVPSPDPIPQKTKNKKINTQKSKTDVPIKKVKVTKPAVKPAKKTSKVSTTPGKKADGGGKVGSGKRGEGDQGSAGSGTSDSGDGKTDGSGDGPGDKGDGDDFFGSGFGSGAGDGAFDGDGVLTRTIIRQPNLAHLISESGVFSFNVCVNRKGKVTYVEYNEKHSTIKDKKLIRRALASANEYLFETKASAPSRECGRVRIEIKITR